LQPVIFAKVARSENLPGKGRMRNTGFAVYWFHIIVCQTWSFRDRKDHSCKTETTQTAMHTCRQMQKRLWPVRNKHQLLEHVVWQFWHYVLPAA